MNKESKSSFDVSLPLGTVAFRSWLSIKPWVMVWLCYLNVLYLTAFYYLPQPEAYWALISYVLILPIAAIFIVTQRGLTRLSGIMHLPWLMFVIYLGVQILSGTQGSSTEPFYNSWLLLLFWSTVLCVLLDIWDVIRWFRGERYTLGTPAAVLVGASRLADQR